MSAKDKKKTIREMTSAVLGRKTKMCHFLEHKDMKVVYKRFVLIDSELERVLLAELKFLSPNNYYKGWYQAHHVK